MKKSKKNIFYFLNSMTSTKEDLDFSDDEIKKGYEKFFINKWVSMCELFIPLVNEINKYDIPKNVHYEYYKNSLPKRKVFFSFIKKEKIEDDDYNKLVCLCNYYQIGMKDAKEYLLLMSNSEVEKIVRKYQTN